MVFQVLRVGKLPIMVQRATVFKTAKWDSRIGFPRSRRKTV